MKIKIQRLDKTLPLPEYKTSGSVCFDLYSRLDFDIPPKTVQLIPTNIIVGTPEGYMFLLASRSSTPIKKGLLIPNGIGVVDQDYSGPKDEVLFEVYNFTDETVHISKGERIAQGGFVAIAKAQFEEVEQISEKSRGGVGSTG